MITVDRLNGYVTVIYRSVKQARSQEVRRGGGGGGGGDRLILLKAFIRGQIRSRAWGGKSVYIWDSSRENCTTHIL